MVRWNCNGETPSRHVSFASKIVQVGDEDFDEISNEDRIIFMTIQSTAHVGTGIGFVQGSFNILVMFAFQVSCLCISLYILNSSPRCAILHTVHSLASVYSGVYAGASQ